MTINCCPHCGQPFQPRPQIPQQTYCSAPACQRARKRSWQQKKLTSDPDYRENQRDAQRAWLDRHPDYWRNYRDQHQEYVQRNRARQRVRPCPDRSPGIAKMDACLPETFRRGLYRITPSQRVVERAEGWGWLVEITPVCLKCTCKKDACKERT